MHEKLQQQHLLVKQIILDKDYSLNVSKVLQQDAEERSRLLQELIADVLPDIRTLYKQDMLHDLPSEESIQQYLPVFDVVFKDLASTKSVMLSAISHGEISWKKARAGYRKYDESNIPMKIEDIYEDARRYKERCLMLQELDKMVN